jgi:uncharacterized protein
MRAEDNGIHTPDEHAIVDNSAAERIELTVDDLTAFIAYRRAGQRIIFTHTEVPDEFRGRGIGSALVRGALELARQRELEVVPLCPFVAAYLRRHPAYLELVSEQDRKRLNLD